MSLKSHQARKALAVAGIGAAAALSAAGTANAAQIQLTYLCNYPLIGIEALQANVTASVPDEWPIDRPTGRWSITAEATTSANTWTGLNTLKGKRLETVENLPVDPEFPNSAFGIEASAKVNLPGTPPSVTNVFPLLEIAPYTVPARKAPLKLTATGTTPTITLQRTGLGNITIGNLALNLRLYDAAGEPINVDKTLEDQNLDEDDTTFEVYCKPATAADEILDDDDNPTGEFYEDQNLVLTDINLVNAPNKPGTPTVTLDGNDATVKWGSSTLPRNPAPRSVAKYEFYNGTTKVGEAPGHAASLVAGTEQTTTLTDLPAGNYALTVVAVENNGTTKSNPSLASEPFTVEGTTPVNTAPTKPGKPVLDASSVTDSGFKISWAASTDDKGVDKYLIKWDDQVEEVAGDVTEFTATGLNPDAEYLVTVTAVDAEGLSSPASDVTTVITLPEATDSEPPSAPGAASVEGVTTNSITIKWGAATDNIGVVAYDIYDLAPGGQLVGIVDGDTLTTTIGELTPNKDYTFGIEARDAFGNRGPQVQVSGKTDAVVVPNVKPTAPTGVEAQEVGETSATLSWTASTDSDGTVEKYVVSGIGADKDVTDGTSIDLAGLTADTEYTATIVAVDDDGASSDPATVTFTTDAAPIPNVKPTAPVAPAASAIEENTATVSWGASSDSDGTVEKYVVSGIGADKDVTSGTSIDLTGLEAGKEYTASIVAIDDDGASSDASTVTFTTKAAPIPNVKPTAPTGVEATDVEQTTATLSWTASTDSDGDVVKYVVSGIGADKDVTDGTSIDLTALTPDTEYTATIVAVDDDNASSDAATVTFKTDAPVVVPNVKPTAPTAPAASAIEQTTATLSWGASSDSDGTVEKYVVSGIGADKDVTSGTSIDLTALTAGTEYTASIVAVDDDGASSDAATVTFTTKAAPIPNVKPTAPVAPAASAIEETTATISWGASSDSDGTVEGYEVSGAGATKTVTGTTIDLTGLTQNTSYTITVKAKDDDAALSDAATVTFKTKAAPVTGTAPKITKIGGVGYEYLGGIAVISGENLTGVTSVTIGSKRAGGIISLGAKQLLVFAPAQKAGSYKVTVTTRGGVSSENLLFTYKRLF